MLNNENVIYTDENGTEYLQFKKLLEYKDIISHVYSIGKSSNFRTSGPEYKKALKDYENLCKVVKINSNNIVKPTQNHTSNVKIVNKKINLEEPDINNQEYENTDALITNKKNIALATTNADCILLLLFDPQTKTIANIHSGWKGTIQRISVKTVDMMVQKFNCNPQDIICCICPSIRKCHFEVDKDVKTMFEEEFKDIDLKDIIEQKGNKWHIDTVLINEIILNKRGLKKENIIDSKICSVCNCEKIHSYRVEKEGYGLSTAIIEIK